MNLLGIHHLTAVTADIVANRRYYVETLGLRLVKRSVNQDDVSAYHLFYADAKGSPGTDITFFDWPAPREVRGNSAVTRTAFAVEPGALEFWRERLGAPEVRDIGGRPGFDFEDPEGQRLRIVADPAAGEVTNAVPWQGSGVPAEMALRGLGPITMTVPQGRGSDLILQKALGMTPEREYTEAGATVTVYRMGAGGPHAELHVAVDPSVPPHRPGAGGVHHVAFRVADADYGAWADRLSTLGLRHSGKVDRYWFRSLYFREPGGVLFELATDGPGFAVDEDPRRLGERLILPPFLEGQRAQIEAGLKPLD